MVDILEKRDWRGAYPQITSAPSSEMSTLKEYCTTNLHAKRFVFIIKMQGTVNQHPDYYVIIGNNFRVKFEESNSKESSNVRAISIRTNMKQILPYICTIFSNFNFRCFCDSFKL